MDAQKLRDDLDFISAIIRESRTAIVYDGKDFIVWGLLVTGGLLTTYTFVAQNIYGYFGYLWLGVTVAGWVASIFLRRQGRLHSQARTFASNLLGAVWLGCGAAMTISGACAFIFEEYGASAMMTTLCYILGIGYFITGSLLRYRWIQALAACWWFGGIALFFSPGALDLLLFAAYMAAFQTIPGIWLYLRARRSEFSDMDR